jgi:hypothetical protein
MKECLAAGSGCGHVYVKDVCMSSPLPLDDYQSEAACPAGPSVEEIVNQIQEDCQTLPERYLADTVAPFGGE